MLSALLATLAVGLPDPTMLRPERLLEPAELTIDAGVAGYFSQATKAPSGTVAADPYQEVTLRLRAGVGITRFLKVELVLPVLDAVQEPKDSLSIIRFGDPTIGLTGGGHISLLDGSQSSTERSELTLGPLAELTFPVSGPIIVRPRSDTPLMLSDRGLVVTTGGVAAVLGAMLSWSYSGTAVDLRVSGRGFYRVRSAQASDGAGFDLRAQAVLIDHLLLGGRVDGLFAMGGLEQGLISPSRSSDAAAWLDLTLEAGYRGYRGFDLVAAFSAPVWVGAGSFGLQAMLLASYYLKQ